MSGNGIDTRDKRRFEAATNSKDSLSVMLNLMDRIFWRAGSGLSMNAKWQPGADRLENKKQRKLNERRREIKQ